MSPNSGSTGKAESPTASNRWIAVGIFLVVLAVYVITNPGRIDLIDGQVRYEVALNWLILGRPVLRDPMLAHVLGVPGEKGFRYAPYGPAASLAAMPFVWVGTHYDDPPGEASRFMFALAPSVFGALAAAVLYLFYLELGVAAREALTWTVVAAFATLLWPASDSSFDNGQHACLMLAAAFLGFVSATRRSPKLAALGGLVAGLLFAYQEYFALVLPVLAISTLDWGPWSPAGRAGGARVFLRPFWLLLKFDARGALREFRSPTGLSPEEARAFHRACWRYALFMIAALAGVALSLEYNYLRFGDFFENGKLRLGTRRVYPLFGNPLAGFLTLLFSPGKSVLLYSPPILLGVLGIRRLWRERPQIGFTVVAASALLVLFLSTIAFVGGDWCWGPRYLVPLVPLWALAFPFVPIGKRWGRNLAAGIVGVGLIVQCMAVSVEHQRFFFERGLEDFFWAKDPWFYFKHSALLARPGETWSLIQGPPREAVLFNTDNNPPTYTTYGPPKGFPRSRTSGWMRLYRVFYVPKPWPIWMWDIPPEERPVNIAAWLAGTLGLALLGFAMLSRGFQLPVQRHAA